MWIKSQDKTILVNTDCLMIAGKTRIVATNDINEYLLIGEYKTSERALSVLKEIQCRIETMEQAKISTTVMKISFYVFEMPEE